MQKLLFRIVVVLVAGVSSACGTSDQGVRIEEEAQEDALSDVGIDTSADTAEVLDPISGLAWCFQGEEFLDYYGHVFFVTPLPPDYWGSFLDLSGFLYGEFVCYSVVLPPEAGPTINVNVTELPYSSGCIGDECGRIGSPDVPALIMLDGVVCPDNIPFAPLGYPVRCDL